MYSTITKKQQKQRFKVLKPNATIDEIIWAAGLVSYEDKEDPTPGPIDEALDKLRRLYQSEDSD